MFLEIAWQLFGSKVGQNRAEEVQIPWAAEAFTFDIKRSVRPLQKSGKSKVYSERVACVRAFQKKKKARLVGKAKWNKTDLCLRCPVNCD